MAARPANRQALFDIRGKVLALAGMPIRGTVHATARSRRDAFETARQLRGYGLVVDVRGPDGKLIYEGIRRMTRLRFIEASRLTGLR